MSAAPVAANGVDGFVDALSELGVVPLAEGGLVLYTVVPVTGSLAQHVVCTGVAVEEIAPWPVAPPHWIHLPAEIEFPQSNVGPSPRDGWRAHSWDIPGWGTATEPAAAWLAHVRGVVGQAA